MPQPDNNIGNAIDRLPPQDLNAEIAVLGSMLQDSVAAAKVIEFFGEDGAICFYDSNHQAAYDSIVKVFNSDSKIDVLTVGRELEKQGKLDEVGGRYFLTGLESRVPSAETVIVHAITVLEKAMLRLLVRAGIELTQEAFDPKKSSAEIIDRHERSIFKIASRKLTNGFVPINPVLGEAFHVIDTSHKNPGAVAGVPTGIAELDKVTNGLQRADLIIIAGRPSTGKTALGLNISRNAAIDHKVGVGFFSLEMARWQLGMRLLCTEARVSSHLARGGKLSRDEMTRIANCVNTINEAPIYIDDSPALTVTEIRAKARRLFSEKKVGLFVIDYLQIMRHPEGENRNLAIGFSTASLKALAKELNVPVVVLSQLSRKVEDRGDHRPNLSDLRESGAIEQDADVVLFPFAPDGEGAIIIGKQRNGPTCDVPVFFQKEFTRFFDLSPRGRDAVGSNYHNRESERESLPF